MARTTIKDIARECEVSLSTVSLVLNQHPRISAATREKVLAAVERHQYQPNAFARSLASRSSGMLSVVVPRLSRVFSDAGCGEIVGGIYARATEQGYKVMLDAAGPEFVGTREHLRILKSRQVDAMLFIGSSVQDEYLNDMVQSPAPFLLVNHRVPGVNLNYIVADPGQSGRLAADHLAGLGHRRIGLILGASTHTALAFNAAFRARCLEQGLAEAQLPWADGGFTESGGAEGAAWLLRRHPDLTALMAGDDRMAVGAIHYLTRQGLKVPEHVSVMGVGDAPQSPLLAPGLTTLRHDLHGIGRAAVDGALALFRQEAAAVQQVLPVEVTVRESTARARV
jgi:LacI family transcriptional regulator